MKPLKITLAIIILFTAGFQAQAQLNPQGIAPGLNTSTADYTTFSFSLQAKTSDLLTEDEAGLVQGMPVRAAVSVEVNNDLFSMGKWVYLPNGGRYFRAQLSSAGAFALSVAFDGFFIPEHAQLFFYNPDKDYIFGGYTYEDNPGSGLFPGPIVEGEIVIIEYFEPDPQKINQAPVFQIKELAHFYKPLNEGTKNGQIGGSWPCHVNINCPEGDQWQDVKRGVARIMLKVGNNYGWCTGSLINNTAQDGTPYFITAEHCGGIASAEDRNFWQFRFNFERPGCAHQGLPPSQSIPGAQLRAIAQLEGGSDLQLLELNFMPPPSFQPYYNGWDRSVNAPLYGVGIHHPNGDVKKISTFTEPAWTVNEAVISGFQMGFRSVWNLLYVQTESGHGVLQPGSSGSSLFNQDKLIVGTASGGNTSCTHTAGNNLYGKFSYHWESNGPFASQQLKPWLDPLGTGQMTLQGIDLYPTPSVQNLQASLNEDFSVELTWDYPAFPNQVENWFNHISNYTNISLQGPQRATKFNIPQQLNIDTFYIKKLSHLFWEHPSYLWGPDKFFSFSIYGSDGQTLLYQSPQLLAHNYQQTSTPVIHELENPVAVTEEFYVAIVPQESGHPSSLTLEVQAAPNSFFGEPNNWQALTSNLKYYELLTSVFGSSINPKTNQKSIYHSEETVIHLGKDLNLFSPENKGVKAASDLMQNMMENVKFYRIFRDSILIAQTENAQVFSFVDTDELIEGETYTYFLTAVYDINPANPYSPDYESSPSQMISVKIAIEEDPTSVVEERYNKLSISPNPSKGIFQILIPGQSEQGIIQIFEINGRLVQTIPVADQTLVSVDLSGRPAGFYLIKYISGNNSSIARVVIY